MTARRLSVYLCPADIERLEHYRHRSRQSTTSGALQDLILSHKVVTVAPAPTGGDGEVVSVSLSVETLQKLAALAAASCSNRSAAARATIRSIAGVTA